MWDEITYPFPNFNGTPIEVWEWISNFIPCFVIDVITYPCRDQSWSIPVKEAPGIISWVKKTKPCSAVYSDDLSWDNPLPVELICVASHWSGGRFRNALKWELLNFQHCMKWSSFNVWVRYFVWNFKGDLWNSTQIFYPYIEIVDFFKHNWNFMSS